MPFVKGQSGNPGGRSRRIPKWVAKFRALEPAAMKLVAAIIEGKEESTVKERLEAVKLALGYSRGRPRESIELTGKDGAPVAVGVESELLRDPSVVAALHAALLRKSGDAGRSAVEGSGGDPVDPGETPHSAE